MSGPPTPWKSGFAFKFHKLAKKGTGILQNFRRDLTLHSAKHEIKRIFRESFRLTASRVARDKPWSTLCKKSHGIPSSPRAAAVAKFRLLTGHDCLCAHLFRFNLVTSPICVLCDTGQDMTAAHLDECSALNDLNCIVKSYNEEMRYLRNLIDTVINMYSTTVFLDEKILFAVMMRKNQMMKSITYSSTEIDPDLEEGDTVEKCAGDEDSHRSTLGKSMTGRIMATRCWPEVLFTEEIRGTKHCPTAPEECEGSRRNRVQIWGPSMRSDEEREGGVPLELTDVYSELERDSLFLCILISLD
ncbi:uncharacterized protein TNCV_4977291 [Trichonephila clavipes]|nr:uncharacterized protein TNCV_4977291 [Trichonephila clavipes]